MNKIVKVVCGLLIISSIGLFSNVDAGDPFIKLDPVTIQAGMTTNENIKDRAIAKIQMGDALEYKGLYEMFQNDISLHDDFYARNEITLNPADSSHAPMIIAKIGERDGKLILKDAKVGMKNYTIPKKILGGGRMYLTSDLKEIMYNMFFDKELSKGMVLDTGVECKFGPGKPYLYIEGELQKYLKEKLYLFTRGELDNQGLENKLVLGMGYNF